MSKNWYSVPGFRECGHSWFDAGFKRMVKKASSTLHELAGGKYARNYEELQSRTPEGKANLERIKKAPWYKLW